jgi:hypothetical protein
MQPSQSSPSSSAPIFPSLLHHSDTDTDGVPSSIPSSIPTITEPTEPVRYSYRRNGVARFSPPSSAVPAPSPAGTATEKNHMGHPEMDPLHAPSSFMHHANEHAEAAEEVAAKDNDILTMDDMANLTCQDTSRIPVCHPCLLCIRLFLALSIVAAASAMVRAYSNHTSSLD